MHTPALIELVGPAGSGKTTLARALRQHGVRTREGRVSPKHLAHAPLFVTTGLRLVPMILRLGPSCTRADLSRIFFLTGMWRAFRRREPGAGPLVLDHGPICQLVTLREFGPTRLGDEQFAPWWSAVLDAWAHTIDLVVWLDAPDEVLIPRVRDRRTPHAIKQRSDEEAREFLRRYRERYGAVLSLLTGPGRVQVLRFSTDRQPVEQVLRALLAVVAPSGAAAAERSDGHARRRDLDRGSASAS